MADSIRRRDDDDVERELRVNHQAAPPPDPPPGGAEGGDESNSANWLIDHPRDTDPFGDTDQHSDPHKLPPHRARHNNRRRP